MDRKRSEVPSVQKTSKEKAYHHGNLRETLIEQGAFLIYQEGISNFSLRKLAKSVGVSATACYNHFENVESLQKEMVRYVTDKLAEALAEAFKNNPCGEVSLSIGVAYVNFFSAYPHYFSLLFDSEVIDIRIMDEEIVSNIPFAPFDILLKSAKTELAKLQIDEKELRDDLLIMWATVHGFAAMANMKGIHFEGDWGALTEKILRNKVKL